jgi:hypothetical protein
MKLINDTIQYLQTLSDRILICDSISSREWATLHLATQLLQSRYKEIIARKGMEIDAVFEFDPALTQPGEKCWKCAAAAEQRLYN